MTVPIRDLFATRIDRRIEEVIKVDQTDEGVIHDEIQEYVVTKTIGRHFGEILDRYLETPNKPHEGTSVWVSGFFGSGKSSFAKILGLALENRTIQGAPAAQLFAQRTGEPRLEVLLRTINERIPTHAVIFDVSTDRGIRSGTQTLTEISYRLLLRSLGYASDLDLAELEITLEGDERLATFKQVYTSTFGRSWDDEKGKVALALGQAGRIMHELEPSTYTTNDSWVASAKGRADITPNLLAERCLKLVERRRPGHTLTFVVDEVGQFVARDVQKMLDLQGIAQAIGAKGKGRIWMVVTSQEKLNELVGGIDDRRVELARLMDRYPLQVHLEASDISEVTSRRVLTKNAEAQKTLRDLYEAHRGRLEANSRLTADITLPPLTAQGFVDLYPLLPYHIDLIINVVSGLRTQGGASRHVGGANRTIIKLAQQLLINPRVNLARQPTGALARLDQIYDLVEENVDSDVRAKITATATEVPHPLAQPVAKAICLLQFVQSIHRTPENIAATLHPSVEADSRLPEVRQALEALVTAHKVRLGDDGYRIPTPTEDDWESQRSRLNPKPGDVHRVLARAFESLWQPQPSHTLCGVKAFKAGLHLNNRPIVDGDLVVQVLLAPAGKEYQQICAEARSRSRTEPNVVLWVVPLDEAVDREAVEQFRSDDMLERRSRTAQTRSEQALVAEEKRRRERHERDLKRLLKAACGAGSAYFRGNERSPDASATEVGQMASRFLAEVLPQVYDRFDEAAARVGKGDIEALLTVEKLSQLPAVFSRLALVHDSSGRTVLTTASGPLAEVMARIEDRYGYGEAPSGRALADYFGFEPFGWELDTVRLFSLALLRAGSVEVTSRGQVIDSALSVPAKEVFTNNNLFKASTFRPKKGLEFAELVRAATAFKAVFGRELPELEESAAARSIREGLGPLEEQVDEAHDLLVRHDLPGTALLSEAVDAMRAVRSGSEQNAILTFNGAHAQIADAVKHAAEIEGKLTGPALEDLRRARRALDVYWPFLAAEPGTTDELREAAASLADTLRRETFYRELATVDQLARRLEEEYGRRHKEAAEARVSAYGNAVERLTATPGYELLRDDDRLRVSEQLRGYAEKPAASASVPQLRSDTEACQVRLAKAQEEVVRLTTVVPVVNVEAAQFFLGGVETEEQLEAALDGLKQECVRLIGAGNKVVVR
ncbi:MAG: BREX system P-loop protein BrxC [Thermoanaerobaculaceae bacterium]|nr:BREX system P-loop protein BrxC [Thermoanaerobaculaceae bacterium]MDI9621616.1 BREX system P-loop protein BrxC [Acidobacteriota bacterium]